MNEIENYDGRKWDNHSVYTINTGFFFALMGEIAAISKKFAREIVQSHCTYYY